ncbi:hypothetical protein [Lonomia obliqua multiple nucleopolyhedrovirus]|uniref:Uncharacterized protein n=1 Tax=Lonomia obliqua multiple nucleopolyhedrovirus TaxID=134394 RepID=A0A126FCC5_9ABAC|nr:hypothetical protein [Lonomia obliqua multiple nucleopolyhedrovirus]AKN81052.1 hypothetical protein [Lonomia obliqua multiple nucleopolyhedrovirus]
MFIKLITYLHLNGLHGHVKYYKYLFQQLDFDNQLVCHIKDFRKSQLKPVVSNFEIASNVINKHIIYNIIKGICCGRRRTNPYIREVQLAFQYLLDAAKMSKLEQKKLRAFLTKNYNCIQKVNTHFRHSHIEFDEEDYNTVFDLVAYDYEDLLKLETDFVHL